MSKRMRRPWAFTLLFFLALALAAPGSVLAAATKSYAYLYLQGRLTDPSKKTPMVAAEVRLTSADRSFSATTDARGSFLFDKLPLSTFEMHVTTADGKVIQSIEEIDLKVHGARRYKAKLARGEEAMPVIEANESGVRITVPKPAFRWKRFWTQFAIFGGGALILAL